MRRNWYKYILAGLLLVSLTSCNLQSVLPTAAAAQQGTITAQSLQITQLAGTVNAYGQVQTASAAVTPTVADLTSVSTPTSFARSTATPTPDLSISPTPASGVWLIFTENTNCRMGPGGFYPLVATINAGEKVEAVGRTQDSQYFYMRYIDTSAHYCWVPVVYAIQSGTGSSQALKVYTVEPTTTPTVTPTAEFGFRMTYNGIITCNSNYAVRVSITNTGNLTWQSFKIVVVDSTLSKSGTNISDNFVGYDGCNVTSQVASVGSGQTALIANYSTGALSADPTGHTLTVVVTLYSGKGLTGTSLSKEIVVTP